MDSQSEAHNDLAAVPFHLAFIIVKQRPRFNKLFSSRTVQNAAVGRMRKASEVKHARESVQIPRRSGPLVRLVPGAGREPAKDKFLY